MTEGEREMDGDLEDWAKKCMLCIHCYKWKVWLVLH